MRMSPTPPERRPREHAFTIVEVLVAALIVTMVFAGAMYFIVGGGKTQQKTLVRQKMARQLTSMFRGPDGMVATMILDPTVEAMFRRSLSEIAAGTGGALDPRKAQELGDKLEQGVARMADFIRGNTKKAA